MKTLLKLTLFYTYFLFAANAQDIELNYTCKLSGDAPPEMLQYFPNKTQVLSNGKHAVIKSFGSIPLFNTEIIFNSDKKESYVINRSTNTYVLVQDQAENTNKTPTNYRVKNTGITETISGYKCSKYEVIYQEGEENIIVYIWATNALNLPVLQINDNKPSYMAWTFKSKEISGQTIQLEHSMKMNDKNLTITYTMVSHKLDKIDPSIFEIPANFKEMKMPLKR